MKHRSDTGSKNGDRPDPADASGLIRPFDDASPLRRELFSVEQLERHARRLAGELAVKKGARQARLIDRLNENEHILIGAYDQLTVAVNKGLRIAPAGEWLLDNFFVIEDQIRSIRLHLPRSYRRELPVLANGPAAGLPRVYEIILELVAHVDGGVDAVNLNAFVGAFQTVQPLMLGELWAIPIMLRLALIENLRRIAVKLGHARGARDLANDWGGRMAETLEKSPEDWILILGDLTRARIPLSSAFVAELTRRLHDQSPHSPMVRSWLEHQLSLKGSSVQQLILEESQTQAADQVSIGNSFASLRFISALEWPRFVEGQSAVEAVLRDDPAGVYALMDAGSRDSFRHAVEAIARRSPVSEGEVAHLARRLADLARLKDASDSRRSHVGYFLIGEGRAELERGVRLSRNLHAAAGAAILASPLAFYLTGIFALTAALLAAALARSLRAGIPEAALALVAAPAALCILQLAIGLMNWFVTLRVPPRPLVRMDFKDGIPAERRTLTVIPTLIGSAAGVKELLDKLEVYYLGNRDPYLHFGLLTDFPDAGAESLPEDEELIHLAREGIESLNAKYSRKDGPTRRSEDGTDDESGDNPARADPFYLFHRPRRFNACEGRWIGWERKRGKLIELNRLILGQGECGFSDIAGDRFALPLMRYVITLDADTRLPPGAAHKLIGALSHPLNEAVLDEKLGRVVKGYGVLQPRVGVQLPNDARSPFSLLCTMEVGIDPYTRVVSDVYQDLFGEGSFVGKGIYDVKAFQSACSEFPENTILSHDLLEGAYLRSGFVSDVEFYEDFPSRYLTDASRRHRWMRGDWQIAAWLLPRIPGSGGWRANPISPLSKWKIFDNLRRSLTPPALLATLAAGWLSPWPAHAGGATLLVIGVVAAPAAIAAAMRLLKKTSAIPLRIHLLSSRPVVAGQFAQFALTLAFLPFETCLSLDAVIRTLVRMGITRRNLLQWTTAHDAGRNGRNDLTSTFLAMFVGPATAAALTAAIAILRPEHLAPSIALLALWLVSPLAAWRISRIIPPRKSELAPERIDFLRGSARRTWHFFETFVNARENWLPPDNFQENPGSVVAGRTSPTNIGLGLMANLAARDFGYCSAGELLRRTGLTLDTMEKLERHRGHFYNWYDTRTLKPLLPQYVSTVDSGNLAVFLLVLREGFLELSDAPVALPACLGGQRDGLKVLQEVVRGNEKIAGAGLVEQRRWSEQAQQAVRLIESEGSDSLKAAGVSFAIETLEKLLEATAGLGRSSGKPILPGSDAAAAWADAIRHGLEDHRADLTALAPWAKNGPPPDELLKLAGREDSPNPARELIERWQALESRATLRQLAQASAELDPLFEALLDSPPAPMLEPAVAWLRALRDGLAAGARFAIERLLLIAALAARCDELADMDFAFLFDSERRLFTVGYNVSLHRRDAGFYDLLASEARLASYFAIARGQLDQDHWFALGRMLTTTAGTAALLSWSGSMFEYLMPLLVMPTYDDTLLDATYGAVVRRQIEYARGGSVPWGISESAYNVVDAHLTYQYKAFGIPGLGLKRGLGEDLVIAPYATVLALMVEPELASRNLQRLADQGMLGDYGFYEAIDYTQSRVPRGASGATIRAFFAHHSGMGLLAIAHLLLDRPMQRRFLAEPGFRSMNLLLQERVPQAVAPIYPHASEANRPPASADSVETESSRTLAGPPAPAPEVHLLSNGNYHVMVAASGGGFSRWRDLAITRWREDSTRDCWGTFCYVRDLESGRVWSNAWQPSLMPSRDYRAIFSQGKAEFFRRDNEIEVQTEISVSPEDDIELRRIKLTNFSGRVRTIELTSYAEIVLAPQAQDTSHPAFSNLFVQTELAPESHGILISRRPRSSKENPPWMIHLMTVSGETEGETGYETDRMRFIGRGRSPRNPVAMENRSLGGSAGAVLDPIAAIRRVVRIEPGESARIGLISGASPTRDGALTLIERYRDSRLEERVFELAWTHSHVALRQLNATEHEARLFGRLAGPMIFANPLHRPASSVIARNRRTQSGLWAYGISGDLPILLVRVREAARLDLVKSAMKAHAFWRFKGLISDLVIWNEDDSVYRQSMQEQIMALIASSPSSGLVDAPGGVFVRRAEQIPEEDRLLLQSVARVVLSDLDGTFQEQVEISRKPELPPPVLRPSSRALPEPAPAPPERDLAFFNGVGGFTRDGKEYVAVLRPGENTPLPWVNVIANRSGFGTIVGESGGIYTWAENCREFRLTPWFNDPVGGDGGEALYLRDEETGRYWSPTPLPARGSGSYIVHHGFGYSSFETIEDGIASDALCYVSMNHPVKFVRINLVNRSGRPRTVSATAYWELVLGELRSRTSMHIATEIDPVTGAIFARNRYHSEFSGKVVFIDASESSRSHTADRLEFIGPCGSPARPEAMRRARLSNRTGVCLDPCAAIQCAVRLGPGEQKQIVFTIGCADNEDEARKLVQRSRSSDAAYRALEKVWEYWGRTLGAVYIETPEPAVNHLVNGWLLYQTLSSRLWGRSGFYQSGGAYGFRDQLQDAMALVHAEPGLLREQLLRAAARQFEEGDVQHWWHPQSGRGVRSKCSDDFLWLPLAACRYVAATGDTGVWDEDAGFLKGRPVREEEESYYDLPDRSARSASLYEHCALAIKNGLRFGAHGLPLIGSCDWNDGMNLVGERGKGESVWLAFFLFQTLRDFAVHAKSRDDEPFADQCLAEAAALQLRIRENAWDGEWYRRAYFDDGTPLGSRENEECQIDSLPQSWSVLSGAGDRQRSIEAMRSVEKHLVRRDDALIQLFEPPFDKSTLDPGYIKGYIPGVRENGGQYTHAAIWTVMAFAALGETEKAWELFDLINPIRHGATADGIRKYMAEPYVVAADVYAMEPHVGRGGWTWYTGSAAWMYRLLMESLLGLRLEGGMLRLEPQLPKSWPEIKIHYRFRETVYHIVVRNVDAGPPRLTVDGVEQADGLVRMIDDRQPHAVELEAGKPIAPLPAGAAAPTSALRR